MSQEAFIVDLVRSPLGRGKLGSSLSEIHPVDLGAIPVKALIQRNNLDPKNIEDLIYGCVTAVAEQGMNIARIIALIALVKIYQGYKLIVCVVLGFKLWNLLSKLSKPVIMSF